MEKKLRVFLTWETKLFGKWETQKEMVLEDPAAEPQPAPANVPASCSQ